MISATTQAELSAREKAIFDAAKNQAEAVDLGNILNDIERQRNRGGSLLGDIVERQESYGAGQRDVKALQERKAIEACESRTRYIFASRSLGEQGLRDIFAEASAHPEITVVFQGIPEGSKIPKAFLDLQALAKEYDPVPSIALNPLLFNRHDVTVVPEIMALTEGEWINQKCHQSVRTRIAGITSAKFLEERLDEGDLGKLGPVVGISEPNLMDVIARRIQTVDWEEKKNRAVENVWNNVPMYPLPAATEDRIIKIDPTVEALQDIKDANGRVLISAGTRVNPLDIKTFDSILIVFNPLREQELQVAKTMVEEYVNSGKSVIPVLSEIDKAQGWEMYNGIAREINHPVYMLTPELKQRFGIMRTLSVVRASGRFFELREVKVER